VQPPNGFIPLSPTTEFQRGGLSNYGSSLKLVSKQNYQNNSKTRLTALCLDSGTTRVSQYQKSKTKLDFTEARDSEWQWHQLNHTQNNQTVKIYSLAQADEIRMKQNPPK